MGWKLVPGTGYCETGGQLVFLDLRRDRYFALGGNDRSAFERLRSGEPNDSDAMTRLVATGLLDRCDGLSQIEPTKVEVPDHDLSAVFGASFDLVMVVRAGLALHWARRAMRPNRLAQTFESLQARRSALGGETDDRAATAFAAGYAANRWIQRAPPRCLVDALALDHILLSRGHAATFVFGVRTAPFKAHCWLQTASVVLTGTAAEARNFTPILVIR